MLNSCLQSCWLGLCLVALVSTSWLESRFSWARLWIFESVFAIVQLACDIAYDIYLYHTRRSKNAPLAATEQGDLPSAFGPSVQ
jgi:hypothetical protein